MRLFIAVELGETIIAAATQTAEDLRKRIGAALRPKWVPAANLHLTVRFIGHVPDERVPAIVEAVQPPIDLAPFEIALGECGVFPPHGPPRVLWIGLTDGLPSLRALHDEFNRRLAPLGFAPEDRPFNAHLTLARVKDAPRGSGAAATEALRALRPQSARSLIAQVTLFESRLSPHGPAYAPLVHIPLLR